MKFKRLALNTVFFLLFSLQFLYSQTHPQSSQIFNTLKQAGLQPSRQLLQRSNSFDFPYNIVLSFGSTNSRNLVFAFNQDDFSVFSDDIIAICQAAQKKTPKDRMIIVLTANDISLLPDYLAIDNQGTKTFIDSMDSSIPSAVFLFKSSPQQKTDVEIIAGANLKTIPRWLFEYCTTSLNRLGYSAKLSGDFISFYRLGIMQENKQISSYIGAQIPAVMYTTKDGSILPLMVDAESYFSEEIPVDWDIHYLYLNFFNTKFTLSEQNLLIILFGLTALLLLSIYIFSFFIGDKSVDHFQDFKKTWFLIPTMAFFTSVCLTLGEWMAIQLLSEASSVYAISMMKVVCTFIAFALFSFIHRWIPFPDREYVYGYLLILISLINIFIFSAVDLSFFLLFGIQAIIAYFASKLRNLFSLVMTGLLLGIPFIPFILTDDQAVRYNFAAVFYKSGFEQNLFFSFAILPFEIAWIRILVRLKLFGRKPKKSRIYNAVASIAFGAMIIAVFVLRSANQQTQPLEQLIHQTAGDIQIETSRYNYLDRSAVQLIVRHNQTPIRYDITVKTAKVNTIYDSSLPYKITTMEEGSQFILDEYPPNPFTLAFSTDTDTDCLIQIRAFSTDQSGCLFSEEKHITLEAKKNGQ